MCTDSVRICVCCVLLQVTSQGHTAGGTAVGSSAATAADVALAVSIARDNFAEATERRAALARGLHLVAKVERASTRTTTASTAATAAAFTGAGAPESSGSSTEQQQQQLQKQQHKQQQEGWQEAAALLQQAVAEFTAAREERRASDAKAALAKLRADHAVRAMDEVRQRLHNGFMQHRVHALCSCALHDAALLYRAL
jgi:hypothetical protein